MPSYLLWGEIDRLSGCLAERHHLVHKQGSEHQVIYHFNSPPAHSGTVIESLIAERHVYKVM